MPDLEREILLFVFIVEEADRSLLQAVVIKEEAESAAGGRVLPGTAAKRAW